MSWSRRQEKDMYWFWRPLTDCTISRTEFAFSHITTCNLSSAMLNVKVTATLAEQIIRPCWRSALYWVLSSFILHFTRWHLNEPKLSLFKLHRARNRVAKSKTPSANLSKVIIKVVSSRPKWLEKQLDLCPSVIEWEKREWPLQILSLGQSEGKFY